MPVIPVLGRWGKGFSLVLGQPGLCSGFKVSLESVEKILLRELEGREREVGGGGRIEQEGKEKRGKGKGGGNDRDKACLQPEGQGQG